MYPKGVPERAYQLSCIEAALLHNTLVCLPTGLGKTLIAAVVMHNFTRWFPKVGSTGAGKAVCRAYTASVTLELQAPGSCRGVRVFGSWPTFALTSRCGCVQGKVVFVAPTRPLVNQQIDAVSGGLLYMAVPASHFALAARVNNACT